MLCGNQQQYENISFLSFYDDVFYFIRVKLKNYPSLTFRFAAGLENFCFHFNYLVFLLTSGWRKRATKGMNGPNIKWWHDKVKRKVAPFSEIDPIDFLECHCFDFIHHNLFPKATTDRCLFSMSWRIVGTPVHSIFSYQKEVCHQKQHFGPDWIRVVDAFSSSYWNYESVGADTDANSFHVISIKG